MSIEIKQLYQLISLTFFFKRIILAGVLLATVSSASGQNTSSLLTQLRNTQQDSTRLRLYVQLADTLYAQERFDSLLAVTQRAIPLAVALHSTKSEGQLYYRLSLVYRHQRGLS